MYAFKFGTNNSVVAMRIIAAMRGDGPQVIEPATTSAMEQRHAAEAVAVAGQSMLSLLHPAERLEPAPVIEPDFTAASPPQPALIFSAPEKITDADLKTACASSHELFVAAGKAEEGLAAIKKLIGEFGQKGKTQSAIPQDKRAEFLTKLATLTKGT